MDLLPRGAVDGTGSADIPQLAFEFGDTVSYKPPVCFDLGLAGTTHKPNPASLAFQMGQDLTKRLR